MKVKPDKISETRTPHDGSIRLWKTAVGFIIVERQRPGSWKEYNFGNHEEEMARNKFKELSARAWGKEEGNS